MTVFQEKDYEANSKKAKDFYAYLQKNYAPNPNSRMREDWLGVTYPKILQNKFVWWAWKFVFCPMGFHLFDELQSVDDHYLSCDSCDFVVHIAQDNEPLNGWGKENND